MCGWLVYQAAVRTEDWFEPLSPLSGEPLATGPQAVREYRTQHRVFHIGAAATCCLTMGVFMWAVVKLPVRDAVSAIQLPWIKSPVTSQTTGLGTANAVPGAVGALPAATPARLSTVVPTAIPTLAPTAVPATVPTPIPTAPPKTASAPPSSAPSPEAADHKSSSYAVQAGDTLFSIARRYGVSVQALASVNNISDSSLVKVGEQLKVP